MPVHGCWQTNLASQKAHLASGQAYLKDSIIFQSIEWVKNSMSTLSWSRSLFGTVGLMGLRQL